MAEKDSAGMKKVAVLMLALGAETASEIYKHLDMGTIEMITQEMHKMKFVTDTEKTDVIQEALEHIMESKVTVVKPLDFTRKALEYAWGIESAEEIINSLKESFEGGATFADVKGVDPAHLVGFLENEQPQIVSLILSHLSPDQAAQVLTKFPPDAQEKIITKIATLGKSSSDVLKNIENVLNDKFRQISKSTEKQKGGVTTLAQIMNYIERSTEQRLMEALTRFDEKIASDVKQLMFTFDDINLLNNAAIQIVLREVDQKELVVALRAANEDVKEKICSNMSKRAAETLKEELEFMEPVRLSVIEEAQQKIIEVIRRLEEEGQITISRSQEEEKLV